MWNFLLTLSQPKNIIAINVDSIKKAKIPSIASGQSVDLSYYISKKLTSIDSKTVAVGTKSAVQPGEEPPAVTPGEEGEGEGEEGKTPIAGIIIILVIVVVGLLIFFMAKKKPKG